MDYRGNNSHVILLSPEKNNRFRLKQIIQCLTTNSIYIDNLTVVAAVTFFGLTTNSLTAAWIFYVETIHSRPSSTPSNLIDILSKMRPPTDSLRHQLQKLAEAQMNRTSSTNVPPYSSIPPRRSFIMTPSPTMMDDSKWEDPAVPILITIDSSNHVFGNDNTVILPSRAAPLKVTTASPSIDSENSGSSTPSTSQRIRAANFGSMAAVIIAALNQAGGLTDDLGRTRPIHIGINSGIKIDGKSNTICTEYTQPRRVFPYSSSVARGEKRRAVSV